MVVRRLPLLFVALASLLVLGLATPALTATTPAQDEEPGSLGAMLALAPDVVAGPNPPDVQIAAYANAAAQFEALGVVPPEAIEDGVYLGAYIGATTPLYQPDRLVQYAAVGLRELIGFDIFQVDQSLITGDPPFQTTFLRGRFSEEEITAALTANGYQVLDVDGLDVLSLAEDESFSPDHPIQQIMLASINNLAILDNGTVVYASTLDAIRAVLAVDAGDESSLAERPEIATLLEHLPEDPASAVIVEGEALHGLPPNATPSQVATITAETEELDPVQLALLGVTPGGPVRALGDDPGMPTPPADQAKAEFVAVLLMEDEAAAEAAPAVIEERLATGESLAVRAPFTDFFADWHVEAAADAPVVVVEATFNEESHAGVWLQMYVRRDLGFLAW